MGDGQIDTRVYHGLLRLSWSATGAYSKCFQLGRMEKMIDTNKESLDLKREAKQNIVEVMNGMMTEKQLLELNQVFDEVCSHYLFRKNNKGNK